MKEFKEIIDGIAHSLNIAAGKLVDVYPKLRIEYSWYYTCDNLQFAFCILLGIAVVGLIMLIVAHVEDFAYWDEEDNIKIMKAYKLLSVIIGILTILLLSVTVLKGFMCPDILIINKFID